VGRRPTRKEVDVMFTTSRTILKAAGVAALVLLAGRAAEAGSPLICHPFDAGASPVLPWDTGLGWKTPDPSYDVQKLTADTLRLLSPEAPVLARMENMRRATIYAAQDRRVAAELLNAVLGRATQTPRDALAWFDAGYLLESYRQAEGIAGWDMLAGSDRDGYSFVKKAIATAGPNPEMEFAASLMKFGAPSAEHRRRAEAGAKSGSLLARNLAR
jgi:hypothetical protein